uniref:ABC1 atypical kinase-like domain-containing protein n=1 Tax=Chromera velia CCMP2878 TaxID=1169474 RepID=A0A0G4HJW0_9ALVE|eukprot:Cvel_28252.t1-p1 / transcript=Cvel_28252.t1 / gene=Cvel_28252 / organism=Chromera_velia_CCMP2878 / gene_product=ABC1 family protein C21C3.03, mitochondrial, putative / transcript_product=ABC1 family protein C21C3.03, mitochondrial, putative / location=Cvel_scaffold3661:4800-10441(-) / protein_length=559 / sequence_SO=supercontig / SO=protein_coding / is_pseudo=false
MEREETRFHWIQRLIWQGCRSFVLFCIFFPVAAAAPICWYLEGEYRKWWNRFFCWSLRAAGPAFIKFGQWFAARPDLSPPDLAEELATLHECAPSHDMKTSVRILEETFNRPVGELFESIDPQPIGSGSIGQVHRARLKADLPLEEAGHEVAVKIRHPGVSDKIEMDFALIHQVGRLLDRLPAFKGYRIDEMVATFHTAVAAQVDLTHEALQLEVMRKNFRLWKHVTLPRPIYPLVTHQVLVESWEEGKSIAAVNKESSNAIARQVAMLGVHTLMKMMLFDRCLHTDLHPGNIMVREKPLEGFARWSAEAKRWAYSNLPFFWKNGKERADAVPRTRAHLVLLDAGMTAELTKRECGLLKDFFDGIRKFVGEQVARAVFELSPGAPRELKDKFVKEMKSLLAECRRQWTAGVTSLSSGENCLAAALECCRTCQVALEGNFCAVIVTTMMLEHVQQRLYPEIEIDSIMHMMVAFKEVVERFPMVSDLTDFLLNISASMEHKPLSSYLNFGSGYPQKDPPGSAGAGGSWEDGQRGGGRKGAAPHHPEQQQSVAGVILSGNPS